MATRMCHCVYINSCLVSHQEPSEKNMGRKRVRVPRLLCFRTCFGSKPTSKYCSKAVQKTELLRNGRGRGDDSSADSERVDIKGGGSENGNKIMVVVDSSLEAKGALEWALTHAVQSQDNVVLLHVSKISKQSGHNGKVDQGAYEFLQSMNNICQMRRPGVKVDVALVEGQEKGPIIAEEAKRQRVSLLVIGQRKQSSLLWCLLKRCAGNKNGGGVADYCIQNASCMTIAVRRKSRKLGGYLITTKRHKNFWLLA